MGSLYSPLGAPGVDPLGKNDVEADPVAWASEIKKLEWAHPYRKLIGADAYCSAQDIVPQGASSS